ncbi:MAG: polyribonucleotide nucleotidyltransferase [Acidimicrobiia bacterium]|jgi:polyribonucleotide nucleotidyltransferase|nr:polyribonucleotide nucleotidyltransferase [Acidimicrobiia bacterium]
MADTISISTTVEGHPHKEVTLETGRLARQADGAVTVRLGRTLALVTATAAKSVREGIDFFPLTVDIEERMYAAGKIPGSFFRREGRASDAATLTARLIDRPLRPSFPDAFRNEVHIVGTILGADQENPHDVLAINAASAALMVSGIPFSGPVGAVRIAFSASGEWIPFPTYEEGDESSFEMVVAGRQLPDGDVAIMMVEAGGTESSWSNYQGGSPKLTEEEIARGLEASKPWIRQMVKLQRDLVDEAGAKPPVEYAEQLDYTKEIYEAVVAAAGDRLAETQRIADKVSRLAAEAEIRETVMAQLLPRFAETDRDAEKHLRAAIRAAMKEAVRARIVHEGLRIDGRGTRDLRPLSAEVGLVPTAHGSGLFERGETQALTLATLGMGRMDQMIDGITPQTKKRYMHHYNMPPYSTGETGFMRGPKRREIGHGLLAERALAPVVPSLEEFPYTIRCVSEVLSSNGSTSMASVCGSSLSLMDAGVPIKAPVAGIAMGLVYAEGRYTTLTDILGAEDAFGDMDFKVAGTAEFVTALQLDTKIDGIPADVLAAALAQAKEARLTILEVMAGAIAEPRSEVRDTAPKIISFQIPVEKIGEIIGPKGKVINAIQAESGADITVDDDGTVGTVSIASPDMSKVNEAERQIRLILEPPTAEVGKVYNGKVVNITKFGAFVNILPGRDGLVHISKLGGGRRINQVEDVLSLGEELEVTVEDIDPQGKISLRPVTAGAGGEGGDDTVGGEGERGGSSEEESGAASGREYVSFEDSFEDELRQEFGDLGPAGAAVGGPPSDRGDRGERRGGDRGGDRRGGRRPRRR